MTSPLAPKLASAGLVLLDPVTGEIRRVIALQYVPDTLTRTLQPQGVDVSGGNQLDALRLRSPATETLRLEVELDATDSLENPDADAGPDSVSRLGLFPQLAAFETLLSPSSRTLRDTNKAADDGVIEISPTQGPLAVFVWNRRRAVPVRITELGVTEEAYDTSLNPTRVRITLSLRVLTTADLPWQHPGTNIYLQQLSKQEAMVQALTGGGLSDLGLTTEPWR